MAFQDTAGFVWFPQLANTQSTDLHQPLSKWPITTEDIFLLAWPQLRLSSEFYYAYAN